MKYDFDSIIDRHGKDALAVDGVGAFAGFSPEPPKEGFDLIPMWVADMNFATVPAVTKRLQERAAHPLYSYFLPTDEYFHSIIQWHKTRNGVNDMQPEHIGYENGVLGGVITALNVLCSKGDHVLLHAPTYNGFTQSLKNNGYDIVLSPLVQDEHHVWRMDFADMEKKIRDYHIHAAVFCTPHNPTGRVWEQWEIEKAMEIFKNNDVYVISDEIWSDIILDDHKHIPIQTISEDAKQRTIALYAPSKTFNLAGLVGSYHVIYNKWLKDRVDKEASLSHYNSMNVLSMHGLIGAYTAEGAEWVDELRMVLSKNASYAHHYIHEHFQGVTAARPEGTYLLYLDCETWCKEHHKTLDDVVKAGYEVGVAWTDGRNYHGRSHIRMNLALPFSRIEEAFDRLHKYVFVNETDLIEP